MSYTKYTFVYVEYKRSAFFIENDGLKVGYFDDKYHIKINICIFINLCYLKNNATT